MSPPAPVLHRTGEGTPVLLLHPLGVDRFGQSGDIPDLYRVYGLDAEAIVERAALACTERLRGRISA